MSIRCFFGIHDLIITGSTFLGFYKHATCSRCGDRFQKDGPLNWKYIGPKEPAK